jgi:hypothetical protein
MWFPISLSNPEAAALTVGRWQIGVDNKLLKVTPATLAGLTGKLPVNKTWSGKQYQLDSVAVTPDGSRLVFEVTVHQNPIPLAAILAGLGIVGGIVAAVFLVRELRKWLPIGDVARSVLPYIAGGVLALFGVAAIARALPGKTA